MAWITPKTNWTAADGVAAADFNRIEGNIGQVRSEIPTSLPANGGNADTVGGKAPSAFANASHGHSKSEVGLDRVDNTADRDKHVSYANSAGSASNATNANYATNAGYSNGAGVSNTTNQLSVTSGAPGSPFAGQLWIW